MEYITVKQTAEKWGISTRRVQIFCSSGRIPGVYRFGKSWMIPADATLPSALPKAKKGTLPLPRKSPFLNMTDLYTVPGTAEACIESLRDHAEAQALFEAEIAYYRGDINKVLTHANDFLQSNSGFYAVNAGGMLLALSAMWLGDISLYRRAKIHICEAPWKNSEQKQIMSLSLACVDSAVRDMSNYPEWFKRGQFEHLDPDSHPAAKVFYVKYLLIQAQEMAKGAFSLPDMTGLGLMRCIPYITEPLISRVVAERVIVPEIHLRLLVAVAYHQLGDDESAIMHIDKAITLALPDRLFGILAEYRRNFDNLLDDRLLLRDKEAYAATKELHKTLLSSWTKLHNALNSKNISTALTVREREIARLAAFGLSNMEISKRLNIAVSTVRKIILTAMNKTGTEKRRELGAYV